MKTHKWKDIRQVKITERRMAALNVEAAVHSAAIYLSELREKLGITQAQLAEILDTTQGEVSRTEQREDRKMSTLRRYVEALGGRLEITAVVDGHRVQLRP